MSDFDEEAVAKAVSEIEGEKLAKITSSLLGMAALSEKEILDRLDSIWDHGFESAQKLGIELKLISGS